MTDEEKNEIKYRLEDIGAKVGELALEYIAELEEKISGLLSCKNCSENKGGWICVKEYENKCLAQKIEFIKELEKEKCELLGIIQGKDKVIQELKKELKKANEWHYVKDGIMPAENQWVLVYDGSYTVCNYHSNTPIKWLDNYENEVYEGAIIAWQEIVFPKEIKEK